ncbi:MAG: (2Fe-2S)-binding protein [Armatimonadota bacterium]
MSEPDDVILCRCEEVSLGDVRRAVAEGARTLRGVRIRTRASMGMCQGRTCGRLIAQALANETGRPLASVRPRRVRPPVRPLALDVLSRRDEG